MSNDAIDVPRELAAMETMTARDLREKYRELFGDESRSGNRQWLFRRCAWRIQALAEGGLTERALRRARDLARDVDVRLRPPADVAGQPLPRPGQVTVTSRERIPRPRDCRLPAPGTVLMRPYKGQMHIIEILDNGIFYDGQVYHSLSAVAHAITGGHWNGYLFHPTGIRSLTESPQETQA